MCYVKGLLCRAIKGHGARHLGQAAPALTFCILRNSSSKDEAGAIWSHALERKEGDYVVVGVVANGLTYTCGSASRKGDAIEVHRLHPHHFTSPAKESSMSLVVDVCATGLADADTYMQAATFDSACLSQKNGWMSVNPNNKSVDRHLRPTTQVGTQAASTHEAL
jgi:hypothetical protein